MKEGHTAPLNPDQRNRERFRRCPSAFNGLRPGKKKAHGGPTMRGPPRLFAFALRAGQREAISHTQLRNLPASEYPLILPGRNHARRTRGNRWAKLSNALSGLSNRPLRLTHQWLKSFANRAPGEVSSATRG